MCDEIAIINNGAVVARDTKAALIGRLDAKTLVIEPEEDPKSDPLLPEGVELSRRADGALAFSYRRSRTSPGDILDAVRQAGIRIRDVATEEGHLEDVFLDLTRTPKDAA
jgi:ABC-2 type transport system ATP-binding protein